eukprot:1156499-Pelagomonas_calceolata.AAC.13
MEAFYAGRSSRRPAAVVGGRGAPALQGRRHLCIHGGRRQGLFIGRQRDGAACRSGRADGVRLPNMLVRVGWRRGCGRRGGRCAVRLLALELRQDLASEGVDVRGPAGACQGNLSTKGRARTI